MSIPHGVISPSVVNAADRSNARGVGSFSFKPYLLGIGVVIVTFLIASVPALIGKADPLISAVIVLLIVVAGIRLAFRILPPWVGKSVLDLVSFLVHLMFGTGIKGKK